MNKLAGLFGLLTLLCPSASAAILLGDIFYVSAANGTTQFFLDNFTGIADGCSTPVGFPVCTELAFTGTLFYSYEWNSNTVTGSAVLATAIGPNTANGGAAYAPVNFLLPSTNILSATFLGSLTPVSFVTDLGPIDSTGIVASLDLVAGGGYALLTTEPAPTNVVPEPATATLVGLASMAYLFRRLARRR